MAAAALHALGRGSEIATRFPDQPGASLLAAMLDRGVNAAETSSAGRLFDAACGLLGVHPVARYEGQAPMALEALVLTPRTLDAGWRIGPGNQLDLKPLLAALIGSDPADGADLFHGTVVSALVEWVTQTIEHYGLPPRVLCGGGCFQNAVLAEAMIAGLAAHHIDCHLPIDAPANDGGIALGQAWVAANTGSADDPHHPHRLG